jgi:hypothetical protein
MVITKRLLLLLALVSSNLPADENQWYEIEIIVFENLDPEAVNSETWPDDPGFPDLNELVEIRTKPPASELTQWETGGEVPVPFNDEMAIADPATDGTDAGLPAEPAVQTFGATDAGSPVVETTEIVSPVSPPPFVALAPELLQLESAAGNLRRSSAYNVLLHRGWRQEVTGRDEAVKIHIHGDMATEAFEEELNAAETMVMEPEVDPATIQPAIPNEQMQGQDTVMDAIDVLHGSDVGEGSGVFPPMGEREPAAPPLRMPLDGTLTVSLSRYLHMDLDLVLQKTLPVVEITQPETMDSANVADDELITIIEHPADVDMKRGNALPGGTTEPALRHFYFRMTQSRRMRSTELHYFDHPMFGVLAVIRPYELPEPEVLDMNEIDQQILDDFQ